MMSAKLCKTASLMTSPSVLTIVQLPTEVDFTTSATLIMMANANHRRTAGLLTIASLPRSERQIVSSLFPIIARHFTLARLLTSVKLMGRASLSMIARHYTIVRLMVRALLFPRVVRLSTIASLSRIAQLLGNAGSTLQN